MRGTLRDLPRALPICLVGRSVLDADATDAVFLRHAGQWAAKPFGGVLLSGGDPPRDGESRYSMAFKEPFATLKSKGRRCSVRVLDRDYGVEASPLEVLDELTERFVPDFPLVAPPFSGGAAGYLAYDLKNTIERLPQTVHDDLGLPDMALFWPRRILVHDRLERRIESLTLGLGFPDGCGTPTVLEEKGAAQAAEERRWNGCRDGGDSAAEPFRVGKLESNFTHRAYLEAVAAVRRYILEGDVYQVNLSQRYRFPFEGVPFTLWESLFGINPAAFYAYVDGGDHQVLSTSMERFLFRRGQYIETRPIKGTRKRGHTPEEDQTLCRELMQDPKDDAELSMIVDLLRNDLGRVCLPRTIRVAEHKRLETYQNVHHLVSIVTGRLRPDVTHGALLRATFPGGSITGCPKVRAMEIIDELEPNARHVYTGAIGYLGMHGNLDLNIAIRTAIVTRASCYFSVGGGIVYDSCEEEEYQETLHKGRTLFQLVERMGAAAP